MNTCCPPTIVFTAPPPPPPCSRQHYKKGKQRRSSAQTPKKKMLCVEMNSSNQSCEKKKNFMEDVWKAMTPDMLNKLVDIMIKDFNMPRAEACNFIRQQRDLNKESQMAAAGKCPCTADMAPAIPNMDVRNAMIREFLDVTACKLSDYMAMVLCSKRTRRQKVLSKIMLNNMNAMFGAQEDTKISKVTAFLADKMSLWLDSLFDDTLCPEENSPATDKEENNKDRAGEGERVEVKQEPQEEKQPTEEAE